MTKYPKILNLYFRDKETNYKTLRMGEYSTPAFEYLECNEWIGTEKIDGTNVRVIKRAEMRTFSYNVLEFKGHSDAATIPMFLQKRLEEIFTLPKLQEVFDYNTEVCLYGEGYGNRIQKVGHRYIKDTTGFILFDIKIDDWWLPRSKLKEIADQLSIPLVPVVFMGILQEAVYQMQSGFPSLVSEDPTLPAEGMILKPRVEMRDRGGQRIIAKLKTEDFIK